MGEKEKKEAVKWLNIFTLIADFVKQLLSKKKK